MNKWVYFGAGVVTGIILLFIVIYFMGNNNAQVENQEIADNGIRYYDSPQDIINEQSFEVFQTLAEDAALVRGKLEDTELHLGTIYVLIRDNGKYFYDKEIIKVPKGKVVRMVGTYTYVSQKGIAKTVPIVRILEK